MNYDKHSYDYKDISNISKVVLEIFLFWIRVLGPDPELC